MGNVNLEALLRSYPRVRPPLTDEHRHIYEDEYLRNREGVRVAEGLAKRMEQWMHRKVLGPAGDTLLELGAGTLNHVRFETGTRSYDIVEPFTVLYQNSSFLGQVDDVFASQEEIPTDRRYSRIISVAVLEHMTDLPLELALSALHLREGGVFKAGIPSEGGFLWWLGWRATTGAAYYLRHRIDYGVLMRHEHVNTAPEIIALLNYFFAEVTVQRFPLPGHHLSLYAGIEAKTPYLGRARQMLEARRPTHIDEPAGAQQRATK